MKLLTAALGGMLFFGVSLHSSADARPATEPARAQSARVAAHTRYTQALIAALSQSSEARDLMLAAQLRRSGESDALVREALRRGADDPLLWWIAATGCPHSPLACEASYAVTRLRELDPDNGAVWLLPEGGLGRHAAKPTSEPLDADERLDRIAAATRFDTYDGARLRMYLDGLRTVAVPEELLRPNMGGLVEPTPERVRFVFAMGLSMAHVSMGHTESMRLCGGDEAESLPSGRRDRCLAAFSQVARQADTPIALVVAMATLLRLTPPGPARDEVQRERHKLSWLNSAWTELQRPQGSASDWEAEAATADALIKAWSDPQATELSIMRAALRDAGVALDPPPGWRGWGEARTED